MILYIAGLGVVYITANFVVVSSASKSDQGTVAGVLNVALQVGGSVLGLALLTAMADSINIRFGLPGVVSQQLSEIGYQSLYYSCIVLCSIALMISLIAIKTPDSMRGPYGRRAHPTHRNRPRLSWKSADSSQRIRASHRLLQASLRRLLKRRNKPMRGEVMTKNAGMEALLVDLVPPKFYFPGHTCTCAWCENGW